MDLIIKTNNVTATNYRVRIYKNWLHLKACIAAFENNIQEIFNSIEEFDGPIKDRVKDNTSPFGIAYFNNSFGELMMKPEIRNLDLAEKRFNKALEYNPNHALTHYNLAKLYEEIGNEEKLIIELQKCKTLWKHADPEFKNIYSVSN